MIPSTQLEHAATREKKQLEKKNWQFDFQSYIE